MSTEYEIRIINKNSELPFVHPSPWKNSDSRSHFTKKNSRFGPKCMVLFVKQLPLFCSQALKPVFVPCLGMQCPPPPATQHLPCCKHSQRFHHPRTSIYFKSQKTHAGVSWLALHALKATSSCSLALQPCLWQATYSFCENTQSSRSINRIKERKKKNRCDF